MNFCITEHVQDTTPPVLQSEEPLVSSDGVENTNLESTAMDTNSDILNQVKSLDSDLEQQQLSNDTPIDLNDVTTDVINSDADSNGTLDLETPQINSNSSDLNNVSNEKKKRKKGT